MTQTFHQALQISASLATCIWDPMYQRKPELTKEIQMHNQVSQWSVFGVPGMSKSTDCKCNSRNSKCSMRFKLLALIIQCIHVYMHGSISKPFFVLLPQPATALMLPISSLKHPITSQSDALSMWCLQFTHMLIHNAVFEPYLAEEQ